MGRRFSTQNRFSPVCHQSGERRVGFLALVGQPHSGPLVQSTVEDDGQRRRRLQRLRSAARLGGVLMRIRECCVLPFLFSACLALASHCVAQEQPPPQGTAKPSSPSEGKKRVNKKLRAELSDVDRMWLTEDVLYIITEDERRAFLELGTAEEREQFIEIFWRDRNPDPESPINPVREEHYRRLAYADERFASGVSGRKTDRGHIYIIWGPPDEIESHPTGGTFDRLLEQGGGSTSTYPWELWRYRHLEGIGENIEIEFVDPTGSGEYHITRDPCEKDALAHVPGAGSSLSEVLGRSSKADRFSNSNGTTCPMPLGGATAYMNE